MTYDKQKYLELRRQRVPWRIALALASIPDTVDEVDGGDVDGEA